MIIFSLIIKNDYAAFKTNDDKPTLQEMPSLIKKIVLTTSAYLNSFIYNDQNFDYFNDLY